jgi:Ni,Fe-hydrogenase I cytochrome b subunit
MGKLIAVAVVTALVVVLLGWFVARTWGLPVVKADETETSREAKRLVIRLVSILATTAVLIFCLFLLRAAWDLVT